MVRQEINRRHSLDLWLRIGDGGDYENHGQDFSALADSLREHGILPSDINWLTCPRNPQRHADPYLPSAGFTTPIYDGNNYVSLFWGDGEANLHQPLTKAERSDILRMTA